MKGFSVGLLAVLFLLGISCQKDSKNETADRVLLGGKVWTVNPDQPWAEAVALKSRRIIKVGSTSEIKKWVGPKTRVMSPIGYPSPDDLSGWEISI